METNKPITDYLDRVMLYADRPSGEAAELRAELEDHLLTKATELEAAGMSEVDATFDAIRQTGPADVVGYSLRRFRWIDVRTKGTAKGFIAIGPKAVGVIACGGAALGVVSFAGAGAGVVTVSGFGLGLFLAFAGLAVAPVGVAYGGVSLGLVAIGGLAAGGLALGGAAAGLVADGGITATYWTFAEAPHWQQVMVRFISNKWLFRSVTGIFWMLWLFLFAGMVVCQRKETQRIRAGDPEFSE